MANLHYILVGDESVIAQPTSSGARKGHLQVAIKSDIDDNPAQVYSELVANRLAQFLGLPVALGVVARHEAAPMQDRFASLWVDDGGADVFDFTRGGAPEHDYDIPPKGAHETEWYWEFKRLCDRHPIEAAQLAVFDLWILNDDREPNIKGVIAEDSSPLIYGLDQGASLLSCGVDISESLALLSDMALPKAHPMQGLLNELQCGRMVERICALQEWALMSAVVPGVAVGNVLPDMQFELLDKLMERRKFLQDIVDRVLFPPA